MTTSLELSKRLFELSGWQNKGRFWGALAKNGLQIPVYDCEFLLTKLPIRIDLGDDPGCLALHSLHNGGWAAQYDKRKTAPLYTADADTPEDALCLLAIKLIEEGLL